MKYFISAIAFIIALLSAAWMLVFQESGQKATFAQPAGVGAFLKVPQWHPIAGKETLSAWFESLAEKHQVNVIRTTNEVQANGQQTTRHYVFLSRPSEMLADLSLESGRNLSPSDMEAAQTEVRTPSAKPEFNTVGLLRDIAWEDDVKILPLSVGLERLFPHGTYRLEGSGAATRDFAIDFIEMANTKFPEAPILTLEEVYSTSGSSGNSSSHIYERLIPVCLVFGFIILAVGQAYLVAMSAPIVGVARLHGRSIFRIWFSLLGGVQLAFLVFAIALSSVALPFVSGLSLAECLAIICVAVAASGCVILFSLVSTLLLLVVPLSGALQRHRPTKIPLIGSSFIRVGLAAFAVLATCLLTTEYNAAKAQYALLMKWESANDLGVFYPVVGGEDGHESDAVKRYNDQIRGPLYAELCTRGAIYMDPPGNAAPGFVPVAQVNPNYLKQYPILSEDGSPITVPEDEAKMVVIIPASRIHETDVALDQMVFWEMSSLAGPAGQDVPDAPGAEKNQTFPGISSAEAQSMRDSIVVIRSQPGQEVFTINDTINPDQGNMIRDPIVVVTTLANMGDEGLSSFGAGGGVRDSIKMPLKGEESNVVYQQLLPLLRELGLDDNLKVLVSLEEIAQEELNAAKQGMLWTGISIIALVVLLLGVTTQNVGVFVTYYRRHVAVRRLHGATVVRVHRELSVILLSSWAIFALVSVLILAAATARTSSGISAVYAVITIMGIGFLELLIAYFWARALENKHLVRELKNT